MSISDFVQDYLADQDEGMKAFITFFLNMVMQYESEQQAGAGRYQRTDTRIATRNGTKSRNLRTRYGDLILEKPEFRERPFRTVVFDRYSRIERALITAITESYIQGVSTRKIRHIMKAFGIENISADTVSRLSKELDEQVKEFLTRPIEQPIIYLIVDAVYVKVRHHSRYVNQAILVIAGIREDGMREILGVRVVDSEDEGFWISAFEDLKDRGLHGVQMVISDGHKGIQSAVKTQFLGASWQMCEVHYLRAVLRNVPRKYQKIVTDLLKSALFGKEERLPDIAVELEQMGYRTAADTVERFMLDVANYRSFPKEHWKRIRTTNMVERINAEIKRRTKTVGAFPSRDSLIRLVASILIDMNEDWITGNRYLNMSELVDSRLTDHSFVLMSVKA